jgi:hypothetical protein
MATVRRFRIAVAIGATAKYGDLDLWYGGYQAARSAVGGFTADGPFAQLGSWHDQHRFHQVTPGQLRTIRKLLSFDDIWL